MTQDLPTPSVPYASVCKRATDRRACKQILPPPYPSMDGLITTDRRSYLDRRASWLREFFLDIGGRD